MAAFPKIIYGTAWKAERTADLVVTAALQGFRAIDTACQPKHYREDLVGEALTILKEQHGLDRSAFFIQTKYTPISGQDQKKPLPYNPDDPVSVQVKMSFEKSLSNLRTEKIDALLLHSPLQNLERTLEAWNELISIRNSGQVSLIGLSNTYDIATLQFLTQETGVQPDIIQNRWYQRNDWDKAVVRYCVQNDIHYESFWTLTGSPSLLANNAIEELSRTSKHTTAQVIFRLAQEIGITPLAGSQDELHMKDGVEAENVNLPYPELVAEVLKIVA